MRDSGLEPPCPQCTEPAARDYAAEGPKAGHVFAEYTTLAGGGLPHEMERATCDPKGNWTLRESDGTARALNLPGERLDPKTGDVIISSRAQQRRFEKDRRIRRIK